MLIVRLWTERSNRKPRLTTIVRLAWALGVPPAALLEELT